MKFITALIFLAVSSSAYAVIDADGCYVTYLPGSMYPAVCITGSNEEGAIPTAKVAIFGTNTDTVVWCGRAISIARHSFEANSNHIEFGFDQTTGMNSILINGTKSSDENEQGELTFYEVPMSVELQYLRLDQETTARLLIEMIDSDKCLGL